MKGSQIFVVVKFGFLECADEACNFINVVSVGTGGVESTGRVVVRFLSELWLNYLWGLKPGILPGGCNGSKVFGLGDPRLFCCLGDGFRRLSRAVWRKIVQNVK